MGKYLCPVCGYPNLEQPPWDLNSGSPRFDICPSCGCEFGYDDATPFAKERYRKLWILQGALWFKPELKPKNWSLREQLLNINFNLDELTD